jgi:hypothetical protein
MQTQILVIAMISDFYFGLYSQCSQLLNYGSNNYCFKISHLILKLIVPSNCYSISVQLNFCALNDKNNC